MLALVLAGCSLFHTLAHNVSIYRDKSGPPVNESRIVALDAEQLVAELPKDPEPVPHGGGGMEGMGGMM